MKALNVRTDIAGSTVVVFAHSDHYIDARKVRKTHAWVPDATLIEYVRNGQVRRSFACTTDEAPERIVRLMREHMT